ncbi:transport and Golgi organization protein 6 homolog isoform X2 [Acanthaster planci]|uniref:Transport and Golgi organization protein 6 homolog isoform X2 n=1 Tax=Acanthaster planci TaxID=133434 RepID=A0A8B7ZT81_ACAPL|nr:transport and Golgi organization protein 6 homolog isoform X2 [Acanthaster planci]
MAAPSEFFAVIEILVSPPSKSMDVQLLQEQRTKGPIDDAARFDLSLRSTLRKLHQVVENDKRCCNLAATLGAVFSDWKCRLRAQEDVRWLYVEHCLGLLKGLKHAVCVQMKIFLEEQTQKRCNPQKLGPDAVPPLSPDTFSIGQQKNLTTLLQFIVCLGLVSNLQRGVGIPIEKRSGFGQLLAGRQSVPSSDKLKHVMNILLECVEQPSLGGLILTRHLGDLLAALLQICYSSVSSSSQTQNQLRNEDQKGKEVTPGIEVSDEVALKCSSVESGDVDKSTDKKSLAKSEIPLYDNPGSIGFRSTADSEPGRTLEVENNSSGASCLDGSNISRQESPTDNSAIVEDSARAFIQDEAMNLDRGLKYPGTETQTTHPEELEFFQSQLKRLLQKAFQPMVIRELLFLQGGPGSQRTRDSLKGNAKSGSKGRQNPLPRAPAWLKKECGRLLSERLMQPKGIQSALRGLLDIGDWRKCDAVARVITDCPLQGNTMERYYQLVCPQILELLHFQEQALLKQVLRVTSSCIIAMTTQHPQLASLHLIDPLVEPLQTMLHERVESVPDTGSSLLVEEAALSQCIGDIHHVFTSSLGSGSCLLETLQTVLHPLFELLCFAKQGVCNLRGALEDIVLTFFRYSDKQVALKYLEHVAFLGHDVSLKRMHMGIKFAPGSNGGAVAMIRPKISTDELFAEGLLSQEQRAETVLELLQKVEGLAGDFFIIVLKELTSITSSEMTTPSPHLSDPSRTLLDIEEGQNSQVIRLQHSLQVLAVLSKLCQDLGPGVLENTAQMLAFARATLDRAASSLDVEGHTFDVFETETLTLVFGLVSAILSGDLEKKVTSEHRQALMDLLPSLERISNEHPVEPLQRTATDLRIAIATHGAVWAESMKEATEKLRSSRTFEETATNMLKERSKTADERREASCGRSMQNQPEDADVVAKATVDVDAYKVAGASQPVDQPTPHDPQSSKAATQQTSSNVQGDDDTPLSKDFDEAFQDLFDPLLPTRGHALRALGKLLLAGDPKAIQKQEMLVGIFEENLSHEDSYIYLSAIQALSCVADVFPDRVIPHLCQEFVACQQEDGIKKRPRRTVETRVKLGETLVRATRRLGELVPRYGKVLLGAFLHGAQDTDAVMRASSLSNLADVCRLLKFALGPNLHEVLNCLMKILRSDPEVQARRACILVLTLILRGLGKDAVKALEDVMRDIYRSLKLTLSVEKDDVIRLHCQLALEEIDVIMREYLFPKQTLVKKITVLP